jgi:hypothetical protein
MSRSSGAKVVPGKNLRRSSIGMENPIIFSFQTAGDYFFLVIAGSVF